MPVTKFAIPEIIFGNGSIKHLPRCARMLGGKRILLVSDAGLEHAGWVSIIRQLLENDGLDCVYFNEVTSNPRDSQVHQGAALYQQEEADVIVGLGGGSPIDAAKGIATIAGNDGNIHDYEGINRIMRPLPPMIFLPTTAGSGSDISQYSIITDQKRQIKMSIISRSLVPNVSIIDPTLLTTMSRDLILASAIDALAHAIESYVSKLASPFTESHALQALSLIIKHLEAALEKDSMDALEQLSIASTAAGMSFSNAGLGVGHALAHTIGGKYDVMHGLMHPILLPVVMSFNLPSCPHKMALIGKTILGSRSFDEHTAALAGIEHLTSLFHTLGVPMRLRDIMPADSHAAFQTPEMLEHICRLATEDACHLTNPRHATWQELTQLCREAW